MKRFDISDSCLCWVTSQFICMYLLCVVAVKARRKTATAEDLLFAGASDGSHLSAAAVSPVVISTRAACVVEPAVNPPLIPARSAAAVEQGGSPPERDYSLVPVTKPASSRVNRFLQ